MKIERRDFLKLAGASLAAGVSGMLFLETKASANISDVDPSFADGKTIIIMAHSDDELLWAMPFLPVVARIIIAATPMTYAHLNVYGTLPEWYNNPLPLRGMVSIEEYINKWILDREGRQKIITIEAIKNRLKDIINDPGVERVITHNNWGEYGHTHHRLVNQAVRELAVEYGKDVWMPAFSIFVSSSYQVFPEGNLGLESTRGYFDSPMFYELRGQYLEEDERIKNMPYYQTYPYSIMRTWSWGTGLYDYPAGYQDFVRVVKGGMDYSSNWQIRQLEESIPIYGI